jgi:hypothetical protein
MILLRAVERNFRSTGMNTGAAASVLALTVSAGHVEHSTHDVIPRRRERTVAQSRSLLGKASTAEDAMAHPAPAQPAVITGLFRDALSAERAFRAATALGYEAAEINVLMTDETRHRHFPGGRPARTELESRAAQAAAETPKGEELGGPLGGTVGTIAPVLAAVGTLLLIPGIVIAGPVAVALTAAGAVGLAGGLIGALTDWGIPKDRVRKYEEDVRRGGILIGVKSHSDKDTEQLRREWRAAGGEIGH